MKRLIVVDGLDGSGKNTHASKIKDLLEDRGHTVVMRFHPSTGRFGSASKKALLGHGHVARFIATVFFTMDVLMSVRYYNRSKDGTIIFVRYTLGTAYLPRVLAPHGYQLFKNLLPSPDLALFIDIDPEVAIHRIEMRDHRREMFETKEKLEKVRRNVDSMVSHGWVIVDNSDEGDRPFHLVSQILSDKGFI